MYKKDNWQSHISTFTINLQKGTVIHEVTNSKYERNNFSDFQDNKSIHYFTRIFFPDLQNLCTGISYEETEGPVLWLYYATETCFLLA